MAIQILNPSNAFTSNIKKVNFGDAQAPKTVQSQAVKFSNPVKYMIGATMLAGVIAAGILTHKHIKAKNIKNIAQKLEFPPVQKSPNAGNTIQETINNILGKDSGIKPHTYDLSQEFHTIPVYRNQGGYKDGWVTKDGIIEFGEDMKYPDMRVVSRAICFRPSKAEAILPNKNFTITGGFVEGSKNRLIRISLPDPRAYDDCPTSMILSIISPNKNYTPLQKDIIKLAKHPEKIDNTLFDNILKFKKSNDENGKVIYENLGKYENLDYDLILSTFQSMAKGL